MGQVAEVASDAVDASVVPRVAAVNSPPTRADPATPRTVRLSARRDVTFRSSQAGEITLALPRRGGGAGRPDTEAGSVHVHFHSGGTARFLQESVVPSRDGDD